MCCGNVEFSFQKFVQNNSNSAKLDAQSVVLGVSKEWVYCQKVYYTQLQIDMIFFQFLKKS